MAAWRSKAIEADHRGSRARRCPSPDPARPVADRSRAAAGASPSLRRRPSPRSRSPTTLRRPAPLAAVLTALAVALLGLPAAAGAAGSRDLVISEVYGAGGNAGSDYPADYVELFNRSAEPVGLDERSLQYASATGTG